MDTSPREQQYRETTNNTGRKPEPYPCQSRWCAGSEGQDRRIRRVRKISSATDGFAKGISEISNDCLTHESQHAVFEGNNTWLTLHICRDAK